ncbi:hypothetical protein QOT17_005555 [Balamuthia mandrillaris]
MNEKTELLVSRGGDGEQAHTPQPIVKLLHVGTDNGNESTNELRPPVSADEIDINATIAEAEDFRQQNGSGSGRRRSRWLSIGILVALVTSWVVQAEMVTYSSSYHALSQPFLTTWASTVLYLCLFPLHYSFRSRSSFVLLPASSAEESKRREAFWSLERLREELRRGREEGEEGETGGKKKELTLGRFVGWSVALTAFFAPSVYLYSLSLEYTAAATSLLIYNTTTAHIYILSLLFLRNRFSWFKAFAVVVCLSGVALLCLSDGILSSSSSSSSSPSSSSSKEDDDDKDKGRHEAWKGDVMVAISAFFWSMFAVLFKRSTGNASLLTTHALLSIMGLCVLPLLSFWPLLGMLLGNEASVVVSEAGGGGGTTWWLLLTANVVLLAIVNYVWVSGVAFTDPLFIRLLSNSPSLFLSSFTAPS